jgi:hypothetical protein
MRFYTAFVSRAEDVTLKRAEINGEIDEGDTIVAFVRQEHLFDDLKYLGVDIPLPDVPSPSSCEIRIADSPTERIE